MPFTLCWDCKNATTGACRWSRVLKPVKGWVAEETKNGYIVYECPEFARDAYDFGQRRSQRKMKNKEELE